MDQITQDGRGAGLVLKLSIAGCTKTMENLIGYKVPELTKEEREILNHSLTKDSSNYLTLCEQLRFIYDTVWLIENDEIRNDLTSKLEVAFNMAKKMNSKMMHYQRKYNDATGSKGNNLLPLEFTEERGRIRKERE